MPKEHLTPAEIEVGKTYTDKKTGAWTVLDRKEVFGTDSFVFRVILGKGKGNRRSLPVARFAEMCVTYVDMPKLRKEGEPSEQEKEAPSAELDSNPADQGSVADPQTSQDI